MLKRKEKMNLINNYVEIFRCIFDCKQGILKEKNSIENLKKYTYLLNEILQIKSLYEKIFKENKMMNNSLILLKKQLEESLLEPPPNIRKNTSFETIIITKNRLENEIKNIN